MGARRARAVVALAALLGGLATSSCAGADADQVVPGAAFPALDGVAAPPLRVVWVVRPEDYLTCRTAAEGVRQLQQRFGSVLPVQIIYVGHRPEWLEAFARRQRIDAAVFTTDDRTFRRSFGTNAAPLLYLVAEGVLVDRLPATGEVAPAERWEALIRARLADG
jgi:hypothetical protein